MTVVSSHLFKKRAVNKANRLMSEEVQAGTYRMPRGGGLRYVVRPSYEWYIDYKHKKYGRRYLRWQVIRHV